jgi:hypothetical protein
MADLAAINAVLEVQQGNRKPLADRARSGQLREKEECDLAADIIERKLKRPRHRVAKLQTQYRKKEVARYVVSLEVVDDCPTEAAVAYAMQEFKVKESYVWKALAQYRREALALVNLIYGTVRKS